MAPRIRAVVLILLLSVSVLSGQGGEIRRFGRGTVLDAHNCYPEDGRWTDRLDRALGTGASPIGIEQDLVWVPDHSGGRVIVSHGGAITGQEPTLEDYFFHRVAPLADAALKAGQRDRWPLVVLHFDFKTNEPEHHRAVRRLLDKYRAWLTTAVKPSDPHERTPLVPGPVLVLTENGDGQATQFYDEVAAGEQLTIFGTVPSTTEMPMPLADSDSALPRSYRRWVNLPWAAAEGERQPEATPWTADKTDRLVHLVGAAHDAGWWIRFYTLNGHPTDDGQGWSAGYNFGSLTAAQQRWRAAIAAGVDLVATDQYEELARELARSAGGPR